MTDLRKMKPVDEAEFRRFVADYPGRLTLDCCRIFEPPLFTFNDFSDGKTMPYSIVASYNLDGTVKSNFQIVEDEV
jgi:hypothetical protein